MYSGLQIGSPRALPETADVHDPSRTSAIIPAVRFLRMRPGHGEVVIAEGDVELDGDRERLIEEFRRQLDQGLWAAVPDGSGERREARMVTSFDEVPGDSERVIFFPRAAGG
jgi:hypothetical protein